MPNQNGNHMTLRQMTSRAKTRRKRRRDAHPVRVRQRKIEELRRQRRKKPNDKSLLEKLLGLLGLEN